MANRAGRKTLDATVMWDEEQVEKIKQAETSTSDSQLTGKKEKMKFYTLDNIFSKKCTYNIIFGERSNGKTYAALKYIIEQYVKKGEQGALVRRWKEDFRGKRGQAMFEAFSNGVIEKLTNGAFTTVYYYGGKWYLANKTEDDKLVPASDPFCWGFSLSDVEHDKSTSYPRITTIFFDEFLTRQYYLPDEFVTFMNVVSTIVRQRDNVKIIMAGNTVNKYCPYFTEMGLRHVAEMKKGSIEVYTYGDSRLKVAVEYADSITSSGKPSDKYFAFDNPKLEMITGGAWELAMYPHMPFEYTKAKRMLPKQAIVLEFNNDMVQFDPMYNDSAKWLYIHAKTTPIKDPDKDIIIGFNDNPQPNYIRNLMKSQSKIAAQLRWFFKNDKVFYQNNDIGEVVRNYIVQCAHDVKV